MSRNRRKADRVEVGIPVQLCAHGRIVSAVVRDISRTGLRLRFPADVVTQDLAEAAERVSEMLSPRFSLDLEYRRLGPLLNKTVVPVRIGIPDDAPESIEVCCEFDHFLKDEETGYLDLGSELPSVRANVPQWVKVPDTQAEPTGTVNFIPGDALQLGTPSPSKAEPDNGQPRQRYRALVAGKGVDSPAPFFCHTDLVTGIGVRIRIARAEAGVPEGDDLRTIAVLAFLNKRYGHMLELRLVDQGDDIFAGPARFSGVELPEDQPDQMLLTLAFNRRLTLAELKSLQLVNSAA